MKQNQRRSFFKQLTGFTAAVGGLLSGLVPEAKALGTASVGISSAADTILDSTVQNQLYSKALNDPEVTSLISATGQPGRLDPPPYGRSAVANSSSGSISASVVVLPVVSYSTGMPIAYLYYGTSTAVDPAGNIQSIPVKVCTYVDGTLRASSGNSLQTVNVVKPQSADQLQQYHFQLPQQQGGAHPALTPQQCWTNYQACQTTASGPCQMISVWLVIDVACFAACIGGTFGATCWGCAVVTGILLATIASCNGSLNGCWILYQGCMGTPSGPMPVPISGPMPIQNED